jgi:hypothetical protein
VILFATLLVAAATQPPAWIQRAVPPPIVTWRAADVLGTPIVEGIAIDRDDVSHIVTVNIVDSRFDPPRIVKQRDLPGSTVRWLRAGTRDGLYRYEIAVDVVDHGRETAYLLRVRRGVSRVVGAGHVDQRTGQDRDQHHHAHDDPHPRARVRRPQDHGEDPE